MPLIHRRSFIATSAALLPAFARSSRAETARIEILLDEPIGGVNPNLFGHFTEHIGGVIYDGVWVGEKSRVPNVSGIRKALVDALAPLNPPVIRWPGGCFADSYNWRDGVGPHRAKRTNFWANEMPSVAGGDQKYDPNAFGTHEFMRFCRLVKAEPYFAANVRSLPAMAFRDWVEYCNMPANLTSLGEERARNGDPTPFGVKYWGVGNEPWHCGGNFSASEYASEFRRFTAAAPATDVPLKLIAAGPNAGDEQWTRQFFRSMGDKTPQGQSVFDGFSLHYYCAATGKGDAVDFTNDDWYELLSRAQFMDGLIAKHWNAMGDFDPHHKVKLVVDEWGAWHHPGTEIDPSFLFCQMPTLRDALVSALTLNIFIKNAEKVQMANVAQLINNLHCLFLAHEDKFTVTPNYHIFRMLAGHSGGTSLRTACVAPPVSWHYLSDDSSMPSISAAASIKGKVVTLSVVNASISEAHSTQVIAESATIASACSVTLTSTDIHAHNTFKDPDSVKPNSQNLAVSQPWVVTLPPASVTVFTIKLA